MTLTTIIIIAAISYAAICTITAWAFCALSGRISRDEESGASEGAFPATRFEGE